MKSSHKVVLGIIISFVISAIADSYFLYVNNVKDISFLAHSLVVAVLLFTWCKAHARENDIESIGQKPLLCALVGFIGVPYYAFKCYGLKSGGVLIAKGFLMLILVTFILVLVDYLFASFYV